MAHGVKDNGVKARHNVSLVEVKTLVTGKWHPSPPATALVLDAE